MLTQTRMMRRATIAVKKTGSPTRSWKEVTHQAKDPHSDDEEDETAELLRELEKIKKERAEQKEKEVSVEDELKRPRYCC